MNNLRNWVEKASCSGKSEIFIQDGKFVRKDRDIAKAKKLCRFCPVSKLCMEFALENDLSGVWGGTTNVERKKIKKEREESI